MTSPSPTTSTELMDQELIAAATAASRACAPGAVQMEERAPGQYPEWGRRVVRTLSLRARNNYDIVTRATLERLSTPNTECSSELSSGQLRQLVDAQVQVHQDESISNSSRTSSDPAMDDSGATMSRRLKRMFKKPFKRLGRIRARSDQGARGSMASEPFTRSAHVPTTTPAPILPSTSHSATGPSTTQPQRDEEEQQLPLQPEEEEQQQAEQDQANDNTTHTNEADDPVAALRRRSSRLTELVRRMSHQATRSLSIQSILEIFPTADETRVATMRSEGKSIRTILSIFAEESEHDQQDRMDPVEAEDRAVQIAMQQSLSESAHFERTEEDDDASFAADDFVPASRPGLESQDSLRVLQIMEVFPEASKESVVDRLMHSSMEDVLMDLAEQSQVHNSAELFAAAENTGEQQESSPASRDC